jgi:arylformamidase
MTLKMIDLSGPIQNDMWSYGNPLPPVRIRQIASLEREGWSGHDLQLHTLAGTYIETSDHLFPGRETIDQVAVDRFIATAWVLQLPEKARLETIRAEELEQAAEGLPIRPGDALLLSTGWDGKWGEEDYVSHNPYFLPECMKWIVERDITILGVDIPSVQDPRRDDGELNRLFFAKDRLLLAPLVHLRGLAAGPHTLIALPLNIPGVCGTPCRAVLIDGVELDSDKN